MQESYGDILKIEPGREVESLNLRFWPGMLPLKQRWRNNGLSADFLADYVTTFFPLDESDPATQRRQSEIRGAVSYISNELLENAMKFHSDEVNQPISMQLFLHSEQIVFQLCNGIGQPAATQLKTYIEHFNSHDPGELFITQMEENAVSDTSAGLGFLTMANDYSASLSWGFEPLDADSAMVTTQVVIKI